MYVSFRRRNDRLLLSLVEARRDGAKVVKEHIATLPSLPVEPSVADRIAFWQKLHERLAKLTNRVGAEHQGKILAAIHARVPMVVIDEQRGVQLRNAEADERFWSSLSAMNRALAAGNKELAAVAQRTADECEARARDTEAAAVKAKERAERINRGEDVPGGLGKPLTAEDLERVLREECGFKTADIRHMRLLAALSDEEFQELTDEMLPKLLKARDRAEKAAVLDFFARKLTEQSETEQWR